MEYAKLKSGVAELCKQFELPYVENDSIEKYFGLEYQNSPKYCEYLRVLTEKNGMYVGDLFLTKLRKLIREHIFDLCRKTFGCWFTTDEKMIQLVSPKEGVKATLDLSYGDSVSFVIYRSSPYPQYMSYYQSRSRIDEFFTEGWKVFSDKLNDKTSRPKKK